VCRFLFAAADRGTMSQQEAACCRHTMRGAAMCQILFTLENVQ
jgi:hypothetical protein